MFTVEFDLSDIKQALDEADAVIRTSLHRAARVAAAEGLAEAKARRRYKNRTSRLTDLARARPVSFFGRAAQTEIVWPVHYASYVDGGTSHSRAFGFAGDAYLKAERVLVREVEISFAEAQAILSR